MSLHSSQCHLVSTRTKSEPKKCLLAKIVPCSIMTGNMVEDVITAQGSPALGNLLEKMYRASGYDFRYYRRGTVTRRLARRLHATESPTYQDYMRYLDSCPAEYQKLANDLTIKVSGFFRNPYCYQQVAALMLPELLAGKNACGGREVRLWSCACARGEEPYSLAILLHEFLVKQVRNSNVTVYATDISRWALEEAYKGLYTEKDLENVPPGVLTDYFIPCGQLYEVRSDIRKMVRFAEFDLTSTKEPPFTGLDAVFCCNVLIYLQKSLQERVLGMLYDSLTEGGYLVLGDAENPTASLNGKLKCLDSKAKIYKKVS